MSTHRPQLARRWADERGVFVPGLMGAGILVSMAMLVADGLRKLAPIDGERARAARARAAARGRAEDLLAVVRGEPPRAFRVQRVPRSRQRALLLALLAGAVALALASTTWEVYRSGASVLSDRAWTLSVGFSVSGVFATAAVIWVTAAVVGDRGPLWFERTAGWGVLGTLPAPERRADPLLIPYEEDPGHDARDMQGRALEGRPARGRNGQRRVRGMT